MKHLYSFVLTIALGIFGLQASAQDRGCATMDVYYEQLRANPAMMLDRESIERDIQQWINDNPNYRTQSVITIPVVFHVVYNNAAQNISDNQILAQLDVLNKDFSKTNADANLVPSVFTSVAANTNIQFCLAKRDPSGNATTGIVRKSTTVSAFSSNNAVKYSAQGGSDAWPRGSYLNIWSCNLSGGLLGYAQFPSTTANAATDGVVVLYSSIGSTAFPGSAVPYHLGRTATHEVGHWLDLRHIWGDANCGNDLVSDTPTQQTSNGGCPSFPKVTCSNGPNGDMFMNYMDYTNDACMYMFTAGQAARMNACLNGFRASLQSSLGCVPPGSGGTSCGTPTSLSATSITSTGATLNWAAVSGATSYNVQYRITGAATWTTTSSTTTSRALTGLTASTTYEYQVQANCNGTLSSFSSIASFITTSGTTTCNDTWESNNTSSTSKTISVNTDIFGTISSSTDVDWFRFSTVSPNTYVKVDLTNLPADYDMTLYRSNLNTISTSQNGGTTSEQIKRNTTSATTYYVRVYGYAGAFNTSQCYTLRASTRNSAWRLASGVTEDDALPLESMFHLMPNPAAEFVDLELYASQEQSTTIRVIDMTGRIVLSSDHSLPDGVNKIRLDLSALENGMYVVTAEQPGNFRSQRLMISR